MFDKSPFDQTSYDRWVREIGELIINFPLSVNYVCTGNAYSGRIVCQKGDTFDNARITITDCNKQPLSLHKFTSKVKIYEYSSKEAILELDALATTVPGTINVPLTIDTLDTGYYKMLVVLNYEDEEIIAPSYGFIRLSIV